MHTSPRQPDRAGPGSERSAYTVDVGSNVVHSGHAQGGAGAEQDTHTQDSEKETRIDAARLGKMALSSARYVAQPRAAPQE
jgi:hypothetical protein